MNLLASKRYVIFTPLQLYDLNLAWTKLSLIQITQNNLTLLSLANTKIT